MISWFCFHNFIWKKKWRYIHGPLLIHIHLRSCSCNIYKIPFGLHFERAIYHLHKTLLLTFYTNKVVHVRMQQNNLLTLTWYEWQVADIVSGVDRRPDLGKFAADTLGYRRRIIDKEPPKPAKKCWASNKTGNEVTSWCYLLSLVSRMSCWISMLVVKLFRFLL